MPPAEDEGWIDLSVPADFGSALATALPADTAAALSTDPASPPPPPAGPRLRARWAARPWLGATGLGDAWGGAAGLSVGHQWWSLSGRTVSPAGETRLRGLLPFGGVHGWDLALESTHGAWLGPVGLFGGPALRGGALESDALAVQAALALGPQARLAVQAGPLLPWVAATPTWLLAGDRPGLADAPWQELELAGGLALDLSPLGFRLSGAWRDLAAGPAWEAALGIQLRLL